MCMSNISAYWSIRPLQSFLIAIFLLFILSQEKELSSAAGKLAECQKTIANLGRQLKLLTDLDDVASKPEKLESQGLVKDGGSGQLSADLADGLCEPDLPKRNGSCVSPMPSNGSSLPPAETSVFSGGVDVSW
jgi:hypothetical protein